MNENDSHYHDLKKGHVYVASTSQTSGKIIICLRDGQRGIDYSGTILFVLPSQNIIHSPLMKDYWTRMDK